MGFWDRGGDFRPRRPAREPERTELVPFQEPAKPSRRAFLEREIANFIRSRPKDVAEVIRKWLREEED